MSGKLGFTVPSARDSSPPCMAQKHPAKSPESGDSAAGRAAPPAVGPAGAPTPSIRAEDAVGALQPPGPAPRAAPLSCSPPRRSQLCGYLLHDQLTESSLRLALLLRGRALFSIHRSKSKGGRE